MRTRIKVCCIASADESRMAVEAGVDALGFVCAKPTSPRTIAELLVAEITNVTPPPIATVLLTTERTAVAIADQLRSTRPTAVQILAPIDPAEVARLAELEPYVRRIKVVHVEDGEALDMIPTYSAYAHAFLLDSGKLAGPTPEFGGTGRPHDWAISAEFVEASPLPVFLAGGLSPANVAAAIRRVRPFGVDVCSGVRTEGCLDSGKLSGLVLAAAKADRDLMPT